jgi:hypothetical protein
MKIVYVNDKSVKVGNYSEDTFRFSDVYRKKTRAKMELLKVRKIQQYSKPHWEAIQ